MTDSASNSSNIQKSDRYITIKSASLLANTPDTYIEHLCRDNQISHAYNKSGNFLPELSSLAQILGMDITSISGIDFVPEVEVTNNENGLPDHWLLKTNRNALIHHEDLPLFPTIKDKIKLESKIELELVEDSNIGNIDTNNEGVFLQNPAIDDPILENTKNGLLSNDDELELVSGLSEDLIESGIVSNNFLLEEGKEDDVILETKPIFVPNEGSQGLDTSNSNNPKHLDFNERSDGNKSSFAIKPNPRNPSLIVSAPIVPVPHFPIYEAVPSDHPLARPPIVLPFSTHTPSLKTKIAAIYTQPDSMASKWLPWMRTSMWSKKMVRKAVHNIEIKTEDSLILKSNYQIEIPKGSMFNSEVIFEPTTSSDSKPGNIYEKALVEPQAEVIRMNTTVPFASGHENNILVDYPLSKNDHKTVKAALKIDDALDSAFFSDFAVDINKSQKTEIPDSSQSTRNANVFKKKEFEKPKINDSWDSAIFK